jgi:PAS domain S-box-containing protein
LSALFDKAQLQQICDQVAEEIDAIVSIFAENGEIVCSSKRNRIGTFHAGVAQLMAGEINRYEATAEDAMSKPGVLEGAALPIELDGERLFCVSVSAPIDIARTYCRLVHHWVVALLRENLLVASETRFRDVAESASDWIWEMDANLRFTYVSPRFYETFRVPPEKVIGRTRAEWAAADPGNQAWKDHLAKLEAHVPFRDFAYSMTNGAGEIRHVRIHGKPMYDTTGAFAGYRGTSRDVTDQVKMENELRRAQQLLADSIEKIPEAFSLFDSADRLVVFNSKYRSFLLEDVGVEAVPGMTFEAIIRQGAATGRIPEALGRTEEWVIERLERHRSLSEPHVQQRGEGRWILVSEHRTSDGGTVAIYSDITNIKHRELELADKTQALERLSNQLAKYLSPQIYESIFSGRQEVKLDSRRRKLTVFFSDIVGFTETADRLESEELTGLLNHYLSEMSDIALAHGATIDKYVGDAMLIFFGDPESNGVKQDALQCARMALAMQQRMGELQKTWLDSGVGQPLRCRMGINTGFCTVGNFGSENRMDYTIIGSGVNLASRLETAARPGEILISHETYALIRDEFHCEERGQISVRGISYPVTSYALVAERDAKVEPAGTVDVPYPNFSLHLDPANMSDSERNEAVRRLRDALDKLTGGAA